MRVGAMHVAAVKETLTRIGAADWVRLRVKGSSLHLGATTGDFDYVRLRRVTPSSWRLEELHPRGAGLVWAPVRATRQAKLETLLTRWEVPRHAALDLKWDPKAARARRGSDEGARARRTKSPSRDPEPLVALGRHLARRDASGLDEELRLAVERPEAYFARFAKRLALRGIGAPEDVSGTTLPWVALVGGLAARGSLVELDWKEDVDDARRRLAPLVGRLAPGGVLAASPRQQTARYLDAVGRDLKARGVRLAVVDLQADCFPLVVYEAARHTDVRSLSAKCGRAGFGSLRFIG